MEGGCFDLFSQEPLSAGSNVWPSQPSATGPAHAPAPRAGLDSLDLNSQMPQGEEFPHLHDYDTYLRGNSEEGAGRSRGSGLLPPRAPRSLGVPNQRAGGGASWAARGAALHAPQLNFGASSSVAGSRGGHDDAMPSWPAHGGGNNGVFIGGSSSGAGSGGGGGRGRANSSSRAPGRRRQRVQPWRRPWTWGAVVGVQRGVPDLRKQPTVTTSTLMKKGKPYLKKVLKGPPANLDQLEEMFSGNTVEGSTAFMPGDDYGEGHEDAWAEEAEEDYVQTPRSSSSQKSKRSLGGTTSTCDSPVKKSKSPMVRYVKDISVIRYLQGGRASQQ
ncbi:hypothetical protein C2845_PM01G14200 [Panicum miliaceum]|uniref:Uncharacterized protein n=1 Tax=Panicum miliaceum TaxID=4540 RepID=A0A3L6TKT8_PANMI|nr:hypothetical protein C2845_PM01G14200 [Panicum miliaceum]